MLDKNELQLAVEAAERALLGSILINSSGLLNDGHKSDEAINHARQHITTECFQSDVHRRIFAAMLAMTDPIDVVTVSKQMALTRTLERGDLEYMGDLIQETPTHLYFKHYTKAVLDFYQARTGKTVHTIAVKGGVTL